MNFDVEIKTQPLRPDQRIYSCAITFGEWALHIKRTDHMSPFAGVLFSHYEMHAHNPTQYMHPETYRCSFVVGKGLTPDPQWERLSKSGAWRASKTDHINMDKQLVECARSESTRKELDRQTLNALDIKIREVQTHLSLMYTWQQELEAQTKNNRL